MNIKEFGLATDIWVQDALTRVELLAFYYLRTEDTETFAMRDIVRWIGDIGLPMPNRDRLSKNILKSSRFIRATKKGEFRLHPIVVLELDQRFGGLFLHPNKLQLAEDRDISITRDSLDLAGLSQINSITRD